MKLYYAIGACSLADRIALAEAGIRCEFERVDLHTRTTETGADYAAINPKGYVPALVLDSGEMITENIAILSWIAEQSPKLRPEGPLGWFRLLEALAYISTEVHKSFHAFFVPDVTEEAKDKARALASLRLEYLAASLGDGYLLGPDLTVADPYLFVIMTWARPNGVVLPAPLAAYFERMKARPAVTAALASEGLQV
ncbi:glutathione S-transferase [Caulobacter radicis]|uniref:glutathione S-transferase N-terminal domain-containing protein n=1 Tax=Caulobacter radicis TaxID=2172650 RepID=UPI000D56795D|nr:glutathione S-transferase N-terminal domain-containing protein [Caulobacter radicis]PVM88420.1 glutathione S-transferase [Caulobacter radicis]